MADFPGIDSAQTVATSATSSGTEVPMAETAVDMAGVECRNEGDSRSQPIEAQFPVDAMFTQQNATADHPIVVQ